MEQTKWVFLESDVEALLIPTAVPITIPGGTDVQIVQTLGGHVTVNVRGNLARIDRADAEALGIELKDTSAEIAKTKPSGPLGPVDEDIVWAQLKTVYDPEIPVNIVDLGLVYNVNLKSSYDSDEKIIGNSVEIQMTLTAPACAMGPVIISDAETKVMQIPNVTEVKVEIIFEPPWDKSMMTEAARLELGLF